MSICIIHNASIEKLEEIATEKFLLIPNKNIPQNIYRNPVFRPDQIGLKIFIVPIREIYHLNLTFPLLEYEENYMSSPGSFISQLIGHKGIGSLFSLLSRRDLAHNVVSCYKRLNLSNFSFILVTVQLTEYGERHIDSIILIVFQYIHMLRQHPLPKYFFDELTNFAQSEFEMKDREKAVTFAETLAHAIHIFSPKQIIKGCYSSTEWRPRQIENILAELNPSNLRVTILTKNAKYLETKVEPYYGTEYYVDKIQEDVIQEWKNASLNQDLRLPSPNPYNYTRMNKFINTGKTRRQPELTVLLERARMKVWLSSDQRFLFPKSYFYFKFSSPQTYRTARSWNLTNLMVNMIKHILVESTYPALLAGLSYTLKAAKYGFELLVQGYSEKIFMFLLEILNAIYSTQYTQDVFCTVLHVHKKGLLSCFAEPLKSQSRYLVNTLLSSRVWTRQERWESLQDIELHEVEDFARTFLDKHSLECLGFGNVDKDQICKLSEILLKRRAEYLELRCSNLSLKISSDPNLADWFKTDSVERIVRCEKVILQAETKCSNSFTCEYVERDLLLPLGSNAVVINNEHHTMSMVVFFLQLSSIALEKTCSLELFNHIVRERIISYLRNRIFLGNTIGCDVRKINHTIGLRIQVESQFPPAAVNSAIEDCLEDLDPFLKSLNHSDLKVHLNTLKALKMNSHMKMIDYNQTLWREILEGSYDFRRNHREVEHLNFLTLC
ncbi:insulin-degrading enzyme isoform X2 [Eurytemora carolleeae]|nr:insulin-degrading enzyme isoform X2 [Eurytemora carolleeae]|eukprot:XP_023335027.1 insulin-degrading enzyme-like isoform X2 [Eurytemora affinis]